MSSRKQKPIRWRVRDDKNLKKWVDSHNRKLNRILKKDPSLAEFLPEKLNYKELKQTIISRKEFNTYKYYFEGFNARGGEKPYIGEELERRKGFWSTEREKTFKKEIDKFHKRLKRQIQKDPKNAKAFPDMFDIKQLKKNIQTESDVNNFIASLKRFEGKDAYSLIDIPETDVPRKMNKWWYEEIQKKTEAVNQIRAQRKAEYESLERLSRNEKQGYTLGDIAMGQMKNHDLRPITPIKHYSEPRDIQKMWELLVDEDTQAYWNRRDARTREIYTEEILKTYGDRAEPLIREINSRDIHDFYTRFMSEGASFEFKYRETEAQFKAEFEGLLESWQVEGREEILNAWIIEE